ncbi:MAG: AAA family ATPase [Rubellimicrobium sp.]|nr:AAA family ATPase [Rubellimicrobium sp.]
MRFTRLRLNGFKSFVDPTDLVIAEGLTGIVGPNGCGKSNLLEALRWVMGEMRPSAMRGGGMEDVIFAGAASRPARHFAEVQIVIDNSRRLAPAAFNDADTLEISRRITRDAGSSYRVQGREVRARDVQMLFADAASGAHSPSLVRQGQIAELISARPVARRRILEDAAGIAGLYQRRHEAELRLRGAEQNLARIEDVIATLAAQMAQLGRQVRAARRYREIGQALRRAESLALWRRWDDASRAAAGARAALEAADRAAGLAAAQAAAAAARRGRAESALPPLREELAVAGAVLGRLRVAEATLAAEAQQTGARLEALAAVIAQAEADAERESALDRDAAETLARLTREEEGLSRSDEGHEARLSGAQAAARAAAGALEAVEAAQMRLAEDAARLSARHQGALRLLEDGRRSLTRAAQEAGRARAAAATAQEEEARAQAEHGAARAAEAQAILVARHAEETAAAAEAERAATAQQESAARSARAAAEGEARALESESAALARLVARDARAGGQMLDLVTVAPGFERALGAALGDDLLNPDDPAPGASGWTRPAGPPADPPAGPPPVPALPEGAVPLGPQVTAPPALGPRLAQVGVVAAARGDSLMPMLRPGQRLVSVEGDLWRWDGLRIAAQDAQSGAALRLEQVNRLVGLRRDLEEARARAEGAARAHDHLAARLAALTTAEGLARTARREADRLLTEAHRRTSRAEADLSLAGGRHEAAAAAVARLTTAEDEARVALAQAEADLAALEDPAGARARADAARREVDRAREEMIARRGAADDLRRQAEGRARRAEAIARDRAAWAGRRAAAAGRRDDLANRRAGAGRDLAALRDAPARIAARGDELARDIARSEARATAAADALAAAESALRAAQTEERDSERAAAARREERASAAAAADSAHLAEEEAARRIDDELGGTPATIAAGLVPDPGTVPPLAALESEIAALRRARESLGAVNLRAEEDAAATEAEHTMLLREKSDLDEAVRALRGGIGSLNREGRERLLAAFERVNGNFSALFRHLFAGGEARLELVESDDPLEAGLEIMCQPPGKKLATLSLLSGGEQTLTALALIFAVFLANPAPICVLDEVDAPLDDANVTRFCDLMDEMTRRTETRFLVITHHAVTMSRMDRLFGVTMAEPGVSQLVSVDLGRAESLVA